MGSRGSLIAVKEGSQGYTDETSSQKRGVVVNRLLSDKVNWMFFTRTGVEFSVPT